MCSPYLYYTSVMNEHRPFWVKNAYTFYYGVICCSVIFFSGDICECRFFDVCCGGITDPFTQKIIHFQAALLERPFVVIQCRHASWRRKVDGEKQTGKKAFQWYFSAFPLLDWKMSPMPSKVSCILLLFLVAFLSVTPLCFLSSSFIWAVLRPIVLLLEQDTCMPFCLHFHLSLLTTFLYDVDCSVYSLQQHAFISWRGRGKGQRGTSQPNAALLNRKTYICRDTLTDSPFLPFFLLYFVFVYSILYFSSPSSHPVVTYTVV